MIKSIPALILVGEVFVDFTISSPGSDNKLRLGGIAHAARGFWALGIPFEAAVIAPDYLLELAERYFKSLGCSKFHVLGTVRGAPNLTVIYDATEVGDQEYETLLRDENSVSLSSTPLPISADSDALIFPGTYDLERACSLLPSDVRLHLDVAYDVEDADHVARLNRRVETVFISTSSRLFTSLAQTDILDLLKAFNASAPTTFILKENRGGSRLVSGSDRQVVPIPAQLGVTVNSVGVGDVFAASYVVHLNRGSVEAGWRATYASAAYSQTTYPDLFRTYVQRDLRLTLEEMKHLWGAFLPWERRQEFNIYFAAPDFATGDRAAIDRVLASLSYHNFRVRRPILENGELPLGSNVAALPSTYNADCDLLRQCDLVFAVPTARDPGTLVEVGLAIGARVPVVVFDPTHENANTMVIAGSSHYSDDLDSRLNAVFILLGQERRD